MFQLFNPLSMAVYFVTRHAMSSRTPFKSVPQIPHIKTHATISLKTVEDYSAFVSYEKDMVRQQTSTLGNIFEMYQPQNRGPLPKDFMAHVSRWPSRITAKFSTVMGTPSLHLS
ncbi:hypothetical protein V5O48_008919 [Marasmius crinis-equi]|uniref:Uncharacterized protein n=1 Tax=Marasmius crinis-equi TaxID=585013 RepID=A0ABR3FCQ3_9AGAR